MILLQTRKKTIVKSDFKIALGRKPKISLILKEKKKALLDLKKNILDDLGESSYQANNNMRLGKIQFSFGYQRANLNILNPKECQPYSLLASNLKKRNLYLLYTSSGQAAIATILIGLRDLGARRLIFIGKRPYAQIHLNNPKGQAGARSDIN